MLIIAYYRIDRLKIAMLIVINKVRKRLLVKESKLNILR